MKLQRVAIVESSAIIAEGITTILSRTNRVNIVGIYSSIAEVLPLITDTKIDAVIADIALYRQLEECNDLDDIVVIGIQSALCSEEVLRKFNAIITTHSTPEAIERIVCDTIAAPKERDYSDSHELSERERDVLVLVARGLTNKEIASELVISPHTVISHRKNIVHKTGIRSVAGLTVYAVLNKLIDSEQL
ncbi:MAG: response regulator transcription factor [Alistipes sp.]|jgi:DNA-binding NarL/FixJ family response regulator|nr:response regulator transcription factor [Alistipes sp.]